VIRFCDVPAEINTGRDIRSKFRRIHGTSNPSAVVKLITRRHKETVTPFPPFGASGIERTGLNVFATSGRVSAMFVGGDHWFSYRQTDHMARCAKSAKGCVFMRRQSAAS
jgi:hypothetical protein